MAGYKFKPDVTKTIIEALRKGHFVTNACKMAGIDGDTYYIWLKRGRQGEEPYATFAKEATAARSVVIDKMIDVIQTCAVQGDWRAASWYLEKVDRQNYGQSFKIETEEQKTLEKMSDEEIDQFMHEKGWVRARSTGHSDSE